MRTLKSMISRHLKGQAALGAALFLFGANAETIYVATTGNDNNNGLVEEVTDGVPVTNAVKTVQRGILLASDGDEVVVLPGIYMINGNKVADISPLVVTNSITVRGSTGNPDDVVIKNGYKPSQTGDNRSDKYICQVLQLHHEGALVASMTLADGWLDNKSKNWSIAKYDAVSNPNVPVHLVRDMSACGSVVNMTDGVISNCVIQGGSGKTDTSFSVGIFMNGKDKEKSKLVNCIVRNNYNFEGDEKCWGGGVYVYAEGKSTISGCMISNNVARAVGGGIAAGQHTDNGSQANKDNVEIVNCVITGNYGGYNMSDGSWGNWTAANLRKQGTQGYGGGAGGVFGGTLRNCLIYGNHSRAGSAEHDDAVAKKIRIVGGAVARAKLYGCTVTSNVYERIFGDKLPPKNGPYTEEKYTKDSVSYLSADFAGLYDCEAYNTISSGNIKRIWIGANENDYTDTVDAVNNNYAESGTDCYGNNPACSLSNCCTLPATNGTETAATYSGNIWEDPLLAVTNAPADKLFAYKGFPGAFAPTNKNLLNKGLTAYTSDDELDLFGGDRNLNGLPDIGCIETDSGKDVSLIVFLNMDETRPTHDGLNCVAQIDRIGDKDVELILQVAPNGVPFTAAHNVVTTSVPGDSQVPLQVPLRATGLDRSTDYHARILFREAGETTDRMTGEYQFTTYASPFAIDPVITVEEGRAAVTLTELFASEVTVEFKVGDTVIEIRTVTAKGEVSCENAAIHPSSSVTVTVSVPGSTTPDDSETRVRGTTIYVAPAPVGSDTNQGYMRDWPKATIQGALAAARGEGGIDTIVVQYGRYVQVLSDEQIVIDLPLALCGEDGPDGEKVEIGDRLSFIVDESNVARYHSVIEIDHPDAVVSNVVIDGSTDDAATGCRRGVLLKQGRLVGSTVNKIRTGVDSLVGAGVKMEGGELIDCVISNCNTHAGNITLFYPDGGGLYLTDGLVDRCEIVGNKSNGRKGCGVYMTGGTLRNTLVAKNTGPGQGTGLYQTGGVVENCTIAGNAMGYGFMAVFVGAEARIVNSILWQTEDGHPLVREEGSDITYTCVSTVTPGAGNVYATPSFVNANNGNYRLNNASFSLDSGVALDWMTDGAVDLDGNPRQQGDAVDLGCYERLPYTSNTPWVRFSPESAILRGNGTIDFTAKVLCAPSGAEIEYRWTFGAEEVVTDVPTVTREYNELGQHTVALQVWNKTTNRAIGDKITKSNSVKVYGKNDQIYVSTTGSDTFPYDTEEKAATTLATAYGAILDDAGMEIVVCPGSHSVTKRINIQKAITLRSEKLDPTDTLIDLSGYTENECPLYINRAGVTVQGLTIANLPKTMRAVSVRSASLVENCIVTNNMGGGVGLEVAGAILRNSLVGWNTKNDQGAGVYVTGSGSMVSNCVIVGNRCLGDDKPGGGISANNGTCVIACVISNNTCTGSGSYAGGLYMTGESILRNTLIAGNSAVKHGGAYLKYAPIDGVNVAPTMENCTVVDNTVTGTTAEGVGLYLNIAICAVRNCVIVGNRLAEGDGATDIRLPNNTVSIEHVCYDSATGTVPADKGNFVRDTEKPLFADWANGDYHLAPSSQLRDKGMKLDWHADAKDLDGKPRVLRKAVDIGCYEDKPGGLLVIVK